KGDKLLLVKSFELKKIPIKYTRAQSGSFSWKTESVLKSGNWVKIQVREKGIYKIPYSKLTEWGFSDPGKVNVFGSGGVDLSENPGVTNYDDLIQNTVWHGKNNGADCLFFYAQGLVNWEFNDSEKSFRHNINNYSSVGYYFLSADVGSIKSVELLEELSDSPTTQISSFDAYELHEKEMVNVLTQGSHGSGKQWFGEIIKGGSTINIDLDLVDVDDTKEISLRINAIGRSFQSSDLEVHANQEKIGSLNFTQVNTGNETSRFADEKGKIFQLNANGDQLEIQLSYLANSADINASAWLDFIEINYRRQLRSGNHPVFFRDINSVGDGNVVEFSIENSSAGTRVFDISDVYNIKEVPIELSGSEAKFKRPADNLKEYFVFNSDGTFPEVEFVREIENQNLHGLGTPEFIIIAHPNFLTSANDLADFHRSYDGMSVEVVSADKVYNEFSSGTKNATGIRNFIKMLYDRGSGLKYVLLFGGGSFDNKNIRSNNKNFIPTFQSDNSLSPTSSFVTDDYFVMMDADESVYDGAIDLGIGRIPATTNFEAELVIGKIRNYYSSKTFGDWKNVVCFIADDEDGNLHMRDSEKLADHVNENYREFITDKIYFDSYKQEVTPAGERYPEVTEAINNRVKDGVLVLNYVGHANNRFMADERVLDISDVNTWSNADNLPIFVTATCEFSRYDADETSIGEYILFNPNGGGIALFSTTRVVFAYSNFLLSRSFYDFVFAKDENGKRHRLGDIIRLAKVNTINTTNKRNFSLLGDPALRLSYPANKVLTTSINGQDAYNEPDTIGALQKISVEGFVADFSDNILNDFTGEITLTIYDKEMEMQTLGNGGETPMTFKVQENIIYKGLASVSNGNFSFEFVVPKDISYKLGNGKIVYYAKDNSTDANGAFENFVIGGSSDSDVPDNMGPEIQLFMDSQNFTNGDKTSKSPTLLAYLNDENGINTVGTGIGHDITAVLDDDYSNVIVLNGYYKANINDYTSGTVSFPMRDLPVGKHTLKLKAWDVANNSTEVEIEFEVSGEFNISIVRNYPNPLNNYTFFTFEHNQSGAVLDAIIEIFDLSGRRIDLIATQVGSNGIVSNPVRWDVNGSNVQLRNGIYVYRIMAKNSDGVIALKSGKMMISR
ncbi:type IX secretion system sortase PorU, partial [Draconibacterium sp.]|nr:type IX secretion system sortase PorU [Draconibacterium sp.]